MLKNNTKLYISRFGRRRDARPGGGFRGRGWRLPLALILLVLVVAGRMQWSSGPEYAGGKISGTADVGDGDSLNIGRERIRLEGIDAPEAAQSCTRAGKPWACGREAERHLSRLIGSHAVECTATRRDQHQRLLGQCRAAGRDLNRAMVRDGMAVSFGSRYAADEAAARSEAKGLWSGEFERPQQWRRVNTRR